MSAASSSPIPKRKRLRQPDIFSSSSNKRLRFSSDSDPFSFDSDPLSITPWASTSSSFNKRLRFSFDSHPSSITPGASTSNSSIQKRFKYDVFLSFRGEDTRKNFVDHLYHALKDKGIYTYKDDEKIQKGERIRDDLIKSIEDSKFYIIVFSKNYASSSWCLEELVKIMECHKMPGHTAYPIFYDVEPTQLRKQSGAVGETFAKHENEEAAEKWKAALKEAADLAGWELKNTLDGHQAKFIKKIVQEISLELRSINFGFDEKLVGMETRVKEVVSSLEVGINEVRMIGIKGMGGAGKTTTARAVFDYLYADFEAKSFVENVREVSNGSMFGLKKLQEQVLSKVLNEHVTLDSVTDGKNMMKERMCGKKVLLVLDDVDHIDQLKALAGEPKWFKPGSRILITTRDEQVLVAHRVNVIRDIVLLSKQDAISLFSRYAFGRENPLEGYEELSGKVVRYAAGLPLTVEIMGSFLCGKDKLEWVDAIDRLEKIPLKDTLEKLELSYISLEDEYKEIFLDIACILKGEDKEGAIRILESCGFHARIGLKVLEQRSLITISKYGELGMHDHIEEMGKNIVHRSHPDEPNKHSHMWIDEEIEDILANDMGTEATRCLKLNISRGNERIFMEGLGKMKKLRYLEVNFADYDMVKISLLEVEKTNAFLFVLTSDMRLLDIVFGLQGTIPTRCLNLYRSRVNEIIVMKGLGKMKKLRYLEVIEDSECESDGECFVCNPKFDNTSQFDIPNSLKYLKCIHYPFLYLPKTFQANNLVGLEMESSRRMVQLREEGEKKVLKKLKFLSLLNTHLTTFDFRITPNLETLFLSVSPNLVELFMPVSCRKLNYLHINYTNLRTFDLGLTPNLERLFISSCADFVELHVSAACPNLKFLDLPGSRLRSLDLKLIPNLERLDLAGCDMLVEINAPVGCLKKVGYLNLTGCLRFPQFVFSGGSEPSQVSRSSATLDLVGEYLDSCPLHPNSNLPKLRFRCYYEENLPSSVGNIEKLISFGLCACTDLKKFSDIICSLRYIKKLELDCDIPEFPKDLGQLACLEELWLSSTKIKHLPDSICKLRRLESLEVYNCDHLEKLPEDLGQLKRLKELYVTECCLGKLPEDIGQLESLERLDLWGTTIKHLPDSVCMLKHLKYLYLHRCALLEKLPEDLGQLECLEMLKVSSEKIEYLPDSICMLKHLKYLYLHRCALLEKLPEDLGRLECLKKLDITHTGISHLPQSIFGIKGLLIAAPQKLLWLYDFPSEIKTTYFSISI